MASKKSHKAKSVASRHTRKAAKEKTQLEQNMEHFGKEMEQLGDRIGRHVEEKHKAHEGWWHRTFGITGPLISAIFGVFMLALLIGVMNLMNLPMGIGFVSQISSFLYANIGWFFLISLLFSYASYFSRYYKSAYRPFSPLVAATGVAIMFWLLANAIDIANLSINSPVLANIVLVMGRLIPVAFGVSVFVGYIILVVKISMESPTKGKEGGSPAFNRGFGKISMEKHGSHVSARAREKEGIKRLYRSGKDRILGGVCGGIGEYFQIDPVIIRLLFVILAFAWGFGVLLYIIAWIIIPRNPEHKWDR
jgi:phage shock protein C